MNLQTKWSNPCWRGWGRYQTKWKLRAAQLFEWLFKDFSFWFRIDWLIHFLWLKDRTRKIKENHFHLSVCAVDIFIMTTVPRQLENKQICLERIIRYHSIRVSLDSFTFKRYIKGPLEFVLFHCICHQKYEMIFIFQSEIESKATQWGWWGLRLGRQRPLKLKRNWKISACCDDHSIIFGNHAAIT